MDKNCLSGPGLGVSVYYGRSVLTVGGGHILSRRTPGAVAGAATVV